MKKISLLILISITASCLKQYQYSVREVSEWNDLTTLEKNKILIKPRIKSFLRYSNIITFQILLTVDNQSLSEVELDLKSLRTGIKFREIIDPIQLKTEQGFYITNDSVYTKNRYLKISKQEREEIYLLYYLPLFEDSVSTKEKKYKDVVEQYQSLMATEELVVFLENFILIDEKNISIDTLRFKAVF